VKVVFFIDSLRAGGKERRLVELLKGLKNYPDIQFEIAVMSEDIHFQYISTQDIRVHYLTRKWSKDPSIFLRFYEVCKKANADIIHSWGYLASVYALPTAIWRKAIFVNGFITYAAPVKTFSKLWFGAKLTFPFSDAVVANSMAGLKTHQLEISGRNLCIFNGFDFSRLDNITDKKSIREQFGIKGNYVVGMTANFTEAKDYGTYLRAAGKILGKRKDVTFLCIGSGQHLEAAKKLVDEELSGNILFLGRQDSIESIINVFDVGVLACNTNGHAEGISNAIMEYMALGKPAVVTDSGGNKELVVHKKTGFIVEPFDSGEMARRIEELLDQEEMGRKMGEAGRKRIEEEFNLDKMTSAYVGLYKRLSGNTK